MNSIISYPGGSFNLSSFDSFCLIFILPYKTKINTSRCRFNGTLYIQKKKGKDGLNITYRLVYGRAVITVNGEFGQLLYGSNLFAISSQEEIDRALCHITDKVSTLFDIKVDAFEAKVSWLDGFRDFSLEDKSEYLVTLRQHALSRLNRENYKVGRYHNGYIFANGSRRVRFYDKWAQLLNKQVRQAYKRQKPLPDFIRDFAKTIVRVENHLTKRPLIQEVREFFNSDDRTAGKILTLEFAEHITNKALASLEFNRDIPTFAKYEMLLRNNFKPQVAARVVKFMADVNRLGVERTKRKDLHLFNNRKAQLKKLDLWQTVFADNRLPPLTDFGNDDESMY